MAEAATTLTVDLNVDGQRMRVEALDFAIRSVPEDTPENIVARANTYYEFLKG